MVKMQISWIDRILLYTWLIIKAYSLGMELTGNLYKTTRALFQLVWKVRSQVDFGPRTRIYKIKNKLYWNVNTPGFPSKAFDNVFRKEIAGLLGLKINSEVSTGILAITKKCSLNCEHCFEWNTLNQREGMTEKDIISHIDKLVKLNIGQIILSGGEPINRFEILINVLDYFRESNIEFWINTSGYNLTESKIERLVHTNLTGIIFSLDHYKEGGHDRFRGMKGSFQQVIKSVKIANRYDLVTALSLCATNEFISQENLNRYLKLAGQLGVIFVQILEPKAAGKYEHTDHSLLSDKQAILETFYMNYVRNKESVNGDVVLMYPDYRKRQYGCIGGKKYIYVDADGKIYPCPFCKTSSSQLQHLDMDLSVKQMTCPSINT